MKIELGQEFPGYFQPLYPEEFELFSHFETAAGIPTALFAVTTWKANGKPNVCFHAWGSFHGDKTAFFRRDGQFIPAYPHLCEHSKGAMLLHQLSAPVLL